MPLNRQGGRVRVPPWGGRAKIENSSRRHPRKFVQKRFSGGEEVLAGKWGGLFLGYLLGKNFRRQIAIISFRPGGWMQQSAVPRCAILSVGSTGDIGQ